MNKVNLYNTLTKKKEVLVSIKKNQVGLYTCGPTVYNFAHIGNLRTYIFEDLLKRVLIFNGYKVKHVMNITDVGHLTGDMDMGEDKLELGAKREGKTAWEIAEFYTEAFKKDIEELNILEPDIWCKATDYIKEQIDLIKVLEKKGFTYKTSDGIYFDTSKFKNYNKLSHLKLDELKEGARVEKNLEKRNATDFSLWKFSEVQFDANTPRPTGHPSPSFAEATADKQEGNKRQMEWESPWGIGFPGWHIECSAMSLKLLTGQLDIHCGGIDHINIHHTNEIAQSEAATGKKFFNFWLHGAFLNIAGGKKMAKSEDNFLTIENALIKKGINPLAYRFAALSTHYRKPMEYSEESIKSAENGLKHLYNQVRELKVKSLNLKVDNKFKEEFLLAINNDLNLPQALVVVQKLLKSKLSDEVKLATVLDFDKVLGLEIEKNIQTEELPTGVKSLVDKREQAREERNWAEADRLRTEIEKQGYEVEDTKEGVKVRKI